MIRLILTILTAALATAILAPAGILAWPFRRDGEFAFGITRIWGRTILRVAGVRTTLDLRSPLPQGPVVFVSNHVSAIDIPILFATLPRSFRIVFKRSLLYVPIMGQFLAAGRHVPIDRSRAFQAKRSLERAARRIHDGVSVALFPEGTRSGSGLMGSFKRGSFKLASDAGVPVVPVSLVGVRRVMRDDGIVPGVVEVRIHEAIETDGASSTEAHEALAVRAASVIRNEADGS